MQNSTLEAICIISHLTAHSPMEFPSKMKKVNKACPTSEYLRTRNELSFEPD